MSKIEWLTLVVIIMLGLLVAASVIQTNREISKAGGMRQIIIKAGQNLHEMKKEIVKE